MPKIFQSGQRIGGKYVIHFVLGRGGGGGVVYRAVHDDDTEREPVALKYPAREEEKQALCAIHEHYPGCVGVSPLLDWGSTYIVTELLGPPLTDVLCELSSKPFSCRWTAVGAIGRVLLRSLQAIHSCGFVHCDVQPNNVLLGRDASGLARPFFIDFGCARAFPNGAPIQGDWGSIDFNSICSADSSTRGPHDDLESLGWMLCHALFGDLPWFEFTRKAWEASWKEHRQRVCVLVKRAKAAACERGWKEFGADWEHLQNMPSHLHEFIKRCHRGCQGADMPDYQALNVLLQPPDPRADPEGAAAADLRLFHELIEPLVAEHALQDLGMRIKDRGLVRVPGAGAPWQRRACLNSPAENTDTGKNSPPTPQTSTMIFNFSELDRC